MRNSRKKKTPEEVLIETANKMINECQRMSQSSFWNKATYITPRDFSLSVGGLSPRLEPFSPATLGEIAAQGLAAGHVSDWRRTWMELVHVEPQAFETGILMGGKMMLGRLARIVVVGAMYDILATQHVLLIESGGIARSMTYMPPRLLRKYVSFVRLGRG